MIVSHAKRPRASLFARLGASKDGIAAVEFAYLAPVMLLMFAGAFEVSRAIGVDRRFAIITAMTGDLVARENDVDPAKLDGMMKAIDHVMKPYDTSTLKIGVISVQVENNTPRVKWTYSHNNAQVPQKCSTVGSDDLPPGLVDDRGSVILVKSNYTYAPFSVNYDEMMQIFEGKLNWEDKSTHTPRGVNCVGDATDKTCSQLCSN
jgi:Flp pilus assembly protein TadG